MEKFKQLIVKHWINALLFLFVAIVTVYSIRYAQRYSSTAKNVNDIRAIWQLAITAIAGSVGIGTIINSARSASTAAESMRVTKDKEKREQASHLIPLSAIELFSLNAPFYTKKFIYLINHLTEIKEKNIPDLERDPYGRVNSEKERESYLNSIRDHVYEKAADSSIISLINVGKGSCVNLEYSFKFLNLNDFKNYSLKPDYKFLYQKTHEDCEPFAYSMEIDENLDLMFNDLYIERFVDEVYPEWRDAGNGTDFNYMMQEQHIVEYINIIKPTGELYIKIPNDFMMLCKHYMNMSYFFDRVENGELISGAKKEYFEQWKKEKHIKPIGSLKISFFEESLIRTGEINPNMRRELTYQVSLKDVEIKRENHSLRYYLEVNLSQSETKKKRAYR